MFRVRVLLVAVALSALAAGCTSASTPHAGPEQPSGTASPSPTTHPELVTFRDQTLTFQHPRSWSARHFDENSTFSAAIADLSNQAMHPPCTTRRVKNGIETTCGWPVRHLQPGGLLMRWQQVGVLVPSNWRFTDLPGQAVRVDDRPAKQEISRPGDCASIGATETIRTDIRRSARGNYYRVTACLRGPRIQALEQDAQTILASTHLLQP